MGKRWHVVLISFRAETSEKAREEIFVRLQALGEDCGGKEAGILFWKVGKNLDIRKSVHLVEIAVFKDDEALQSFRRHRKHEEAADILKSVADWQIGGMYD